MMMNVKKEIGTASQQKLTTFVTKNVIFQEQDATYSIRLVTISPLEQKFATMNPQQQSVVQGNPNNVQEMAFVQVDSVLTVPRFVIAVVSQKHVMEQTLTVTAKEMQQEPAVEMEYVTLEKTV